MFLLESRVSLQKDEQGEEDKDEEEHEEGEGNEGEDKEWIRRRRRRLALSLSGWNMWQCDTSDMLGHDWSVGVNKFWDKLK